MNEWRVLLDKEFEAKLKVIKKDDETKRSVLIPGTEFKIYDLTNKKYVEQVTTYPVVKTHKSYFTDAEKRASRLEKEKAETKAAKKSIHERLGEKKQQSAAKKAEKAVDKAVKKNKGQEL